MLDADGLAEGEEPGSNILQVGPAQSSESARRKPHSYGQRPGLAAIFHTGEV